ncbi:toxin-antitoxin system YwqK family antitoxin [Campylobacter jejuni]|uniref:toxin-antitoxin system YwqK family antitoxin n=1 Tax=Campylobacter jejuni TaxID=197 RepID=UPI00119EA69C|nr:hypothetical protein [Campylobacter jejuni]EAJ2986496.1 hypothetical protein [Campylobacter jejuni]EJY2785788.1 hypothetical protein [Campylobacter jejuni]HEF3048706.1 hypothetical protein [Campylobacter jejuni]
MTKFLSICSLIAMLLSGCGSDFPGQPSDVARVQQNKYPNGNLKEEIPYNKDSRIHGLKRAFYDNGQLRAEENYKNGLKNGVFREYKKREIVREEEYKNGILVAKPKN